MAQKQSPPMLMHSSTTSARSKPCCDVSRLIERNGNWNILVIAFILEVIGDNGEGAAARGIPQHQWAWG